MSPKRIAAVGIALAAFAAPAGAGAQDLRSPDAREGSPPVQASQDLRSPDSRYVAPPHAGRVGVDLRSPDSRDAADGRGTFSAPDVMVVKVPEPGPAPVSTADGLDWGDVGIGAGGLIAVAALGLGGALMLGRRRGTATTV